MQNPGFRWTTYRKKTCGDTKSRLLGKNQAPAGMATPHPDFLGKNQAPAGMATPNLDCWAQNPRLFGLGIDNFWNWDQNRKLQDEGYPLGGVLKGDGFRYDGKCWMALD